jgi:hypothetical protein
VTKKQRLLLLLLQICVKQHQMHDVLAPGLYTAILLLLLRSVLFIEHTFVVILD